MSHRYPICWSIQISENAHYSYAVLHLIGPILTTSLLGLPDRSGGHFLVRVHALMAYHYIHALFEGADAWWHAVHRFRSLSTNQWENSYKSMTKMIQMMIITHHHPQANEETTPLIITLIHQNDLVKYLFLYMEFGSFFCHHATTL